MRLLSHTVTSTIFGGGRTLYSSPSPCWRRYQWRRLRCWSPPRPWSPYRTREEAAFLASLLLCVFVTLSLRSHCPGCCLLFRCCWRCCCCRRHRPPFSSVSWLPADPEATAVNERNRTEISLRLRPSAQFILSLERQFPKRNAAVP